MFNYSYHIPTIKAKSPYLNFSIAPMPQPKSAQFNVNYANYWGFAVSKKSSEEKREASWEFIIWLSQKDQSQKYLEQVRKPTARRDLIDWQKDDGELGVFAQQSLTSRSWYQVDNSSIELILNDMIELVITGKKDSLSALKTAQDQITQLMQ